MMKLVCKRNLETNYYEKEESIWCVKIHLDDSQHDITAWVDVLVPDMIIVDADIKFNRYPMKHCTLIEQKAKELIGTNINEDFRKKYMALFMGPEGCPNIMTMLSASLNGMIYFYFPHLLKTGKMKPEEWDSMVRIKLKNDCLAHTMIDEKGK